jgi:hypothetical protein
MESNLKSKLLYGLVNDLCVLRRYECINDFIITINPSHIKSVVIFNQRKLKLHSDGLLAKNYDSIRALKTFQ